MGFSTALWIFCVGTQVAISIVMGNNFMLLATSQTSNNLWGIIGLIMLVGINAGSLFFWLPMLNKLGK